MSRLAHYPEVSRTGSGGSRTFRENGQVIRDDSYLIHERPRLNVHHTGVRNGTLATFSGPTIPMTTAELAGPADEPGWGGRSPSQFPENPLYQGDFRHAATALHSPLLQSIGTISKPDCAIFPEPIRIT